jgi:H+/Cl- antiporter ClcA
MDYVTQILERLKRAWNEAEPSRWVRVLQRLLGQALNNPKLKRGFLQAIPFWIASVITGLLAVGFAKLFGLAEAASKALQETVSWGVFIAMPICFIGSWWIVRRFAPFARGSGIPQVIAAIELSQGRDNDKVPKLLSIRIILVKIASSCVMALGGGAIGREGPTIQIAASVFRKINDMLPEWWPKVSRRTMIVTGAAAGLAAAFNTPLGGIVFVVEELTKTHFSKFRTAIFTAVIIAGLTAEGISGPYLLLGYPKVENYSLGAFWGVILVAIIAGLAGAAMAKLILKIFAWKAGFKTTWQHIGYLLVCSLFLASMTYFLTPRAMGSGNELMTDLLFGSEKHTELYMPLVRILGPVSSFTSGGAGGVFAPSLSSGASIGSAVAAIFDLNAPNTNLLILAGMVAFLTGVTRSPFTSAILVLEMTDRHSLIFHLMAAGMIANLFALSIDRKSFYDHLKDRFLDDLDHVKDVRVAEDMP